MSKLGSHHLNQIFKRVFKNKKFDTCSNIDATLEVLFEEISGFKPPCDYSNTYAFSDRVPIFADATLKENSELCQSLYDRSGEVAIVADSVMSSLNALHLVTITNDRQIPASWLSMMSPDSMFLYTRNISEQDIIVISKLSSFIENHA
tara:strand:- start:145 stop:588 length:444 start_codon:yes stop_codon:yes gene_type:complete